MMTTREKSLRTTRSLGLMLGLLALVLFMPVGHASATQPLRGVHDYVFVNEFDPARGLVLVWEGNISGDIEGCIQWWAAAPPAVTGQATHYDLRWEIWDSCEADATLLLGGSESGSTTVRNLKNSNWRTNGIVEDAAPEFEEWIGRRSHMSGHFEWVILAEGPVPSHGDGIFRLN
jgi:hypothetical protein